VVRGYRFVKDDLKSEHDNNVQWRIGKWKKLDNNKPLKLCENGFHASKQPLDSLSYVFGSRWFICEAKGEILYDSDKFCAREMRLTKEIPISVIKRFALECAKHVLPIFEKQYPEDKRPREVILAVDVYLQNPTEENLERVKQKEDAAWAAAQDAWTAWVAAQDARAATRATAWTAWAAARDAQGAAQDARNERKWQDHQLKKLIKKEI